VYVIIESWVLTAVDIEFVNVTAEHNSQGLSTNHLQSYRRQRLQLFPSELFAGGIGALVKVDQQLACSPSSDITIIFRSCIGANNVNQGAWWDCIRFCVEV
jgi:hypothetical protein